jgi:hypothetical protein
VALRLAVTVTAAIAFKHDLKLPPLAWGWARICGKYAFVHRSQAVGVELDVCQPECSGCCHGHLSSLAGQVRSGPKVIRDLHYLQL